MNNDKTRLAIIIPCYNEELVLESTVIRLKEVLNAIISSGKIAENSYIYMIDDGSKDRTWDIVEKLRTKFGESIKGTKFIRNYGNQKALIAGLLGVREIGKPPPAITSLPALLNVHRGGHKACSQGAPYVGRAQTASPVP